MRHGGLRNAGSDGERYSVRMWGYLPAASSQRAPLLRPTPVPAPLLDAPLESVCNGGCGFALAISDAGKLNTWGSTTDLGQCYLISGKQQECPEPYPLQTDDPIIQAAAGWAHCVAVTGKGSVFTWGWSECVPNSKTNKDAGVTENCCNTEAAHGQEDDVSDCTPNTYLQISPRKCNMGSGKTNSFASPLRPAGNPLAHSKQSGRSGRSGSGKTCEKGGQEGPKKRRLANTEEVGSPETLSTGDENVMAPPSMVCLDPGVTIISVAAGGRHTLALSDGGSVWGWGYGGEGQLGLGSRTRIVSTPQLIHLPGHDIGANRKPTSGGLAVKVSGSFVKAIACGGRHSVVITDAGALLTFGWGLYGQSGQGSTEDVLSPCHVATLGGLNVTGVAAGLWHTLCITDCGDVYACGGNQFGQLGVGGDHAEILPRLVEAPVLEDETAISVACGARHSTILTESGKVFGWGWNKYGQLGLGDTTDKDLPVQVTMDKGARVSSIACGWWHTLALVSEK